MPQRGGAESHAAMGEEIAAIEGGSFMKNIRHRQFSSLCACRLHLRTLRIRVSHSIERGKGIQVPRPGFEPRTPRSKRGMISVSPSGRQWTHRDLNPNFQSAELASSPWTIGPNAMDRRRVERRFPLCERGVLPL